MRVIGLAVVLAVSLLGTPPVAEAQQAGRVWRIGVLELDSDPQLIDRFRDGLRQLGYVESQNITIEVRNAEGRSERLPTLAADLVRRKVAIIVARGTAASRAAKNATGAIPIVMAPSDDPVETGLIASLARPGGNLTGLSILAWEADGKCVQLLRETLRNLTQIAVLWTPANPGHRRALKELERSAGSLGMQLHLAPVREPAELGAAFSGMVTAHVGAVLVLGDAMLGAQRQRIIDLAAKNKLPAVYFNKEFVEAGGLMSYGASRADLFRRVATYVDKILKGAEPADLPVEQPTTFELVINLKTAKALGLTIPQSLLLRADQVIE